MKRIALILTGVICVVRLASASNTFSYTATNTPGATSPPDSIDQSGNPLTAWGLVTSAGGTNGLGDNGADGSGAYFGNPDGGGGIDGGAVGSWQMFSYQNDGVGLGGSIDATNLFAGGALTVGQAVSINFVMRATDNPTNSNPHGTVGVSLMNGTNVAVRFYIYGGGPGYYFYTDAGSTAADAGPMTYKYQSAFNIAFTITGANTYSAIAGSDSWSGTFNGPITGIDVFNHAGGNGSDVGFNNLTIAPELAINNITPNDTAKLFNATNTFSFSVASPAANVSASGVQLILNGTNVSSHLTFVGAGTENVKVSYTNLLLNQSYTGQIAVTNQAGSVVTAAVQFDTFSTNYYTWEAEDFDFNGGQFIDNSLISTTSVNSYYNTVGVSNIDEYVPNFSATQPHLWRTNDQVSTALAGETPRAQFTAAGIPDYLVGYFNPGNWVNYTRTYPAGIYNIYGRLANGNGGLANCSLAEVVSGQGTTNQTLSQLGMFQFTAQGWNNFNFIPLTDASGNILAVTLNGQTTLRVTSGPLGGGVNMNFFMLVPGSNTPPAIVNTYPDGLQPFETTNQLTFGVTTSFSTVNQTNIQVTLNGVNVTSQLSVSGTTTNWSVSLPLPSQGIYTATITAIDAAGHVNTHTETFDNFSQTNFVIEADAFDFNGGQWIDNALETATTVAAANSYYGYPAGNSGNSAEYGIDYDTTNLAGETYIFRLDGNTPGTVSVTATAAGTEATSDFLRDKFINEGSGAQPPFENVPGEAVPTTNVDYDVGWWAPGTWLNYTRTFPTNAYTVWGRLASGAAYTNATMSLVTSGQGTTNQTTQFLGNFADANANGFQSWHWVPLTGNNGKPVVVFLSGVETLQLTAPSGSAGGSLNSHFYMFVPSAVVAPFRAGATVSAGTVSIKFQTQTGHNYTVYYSTSLNPVNWQTLASGISGDNTIKTVTDSTTGGAVRFYRVGAQ